MPGSGHSTYVRIKLGELCERFQNAEELAKKFQPGYEDVPDDTLRRLFATFHGQFNRLFRYLNSRLDSGHYTAEESRELLYLLDEVHTTQRNLDDTPWAFQIIPAYQAVMDRCEGFLQNSGGSAIPDDLTRIDLIETQPLFTLISTLAIERPDRTSWFPTTPIGGGSYASVHKYYDTYYHRWFALKRAHKQLTAAELKRFKIEYDTMEQLHSPYVIEVYHFDEENRQYIMEYADQTLNDYIATTNNTLDRAERINLVQQILRAFRYLHRKEILHRDISTKNILLKHYDGLQVIKISDFGLVKRSDSVLTKSDTDVKGHLNDPTLALTGFKHYDITHETYALVRLIYFVMTGRLQTTNFPHAAYRVFMEKGLSGAVTERYQDIQELQVGFTAMLKQLADQ